MCFHRFYFPAHLSTMNNFWLFNDYKGESQNPWRGLAVFKFLMLILNCILVNLRHSRIYPGRDSQRGNLIFSVFFLKSQFNLHLITYMKFSKLLPHCVWKAFWRAQTTTHTPQVQGSQTAADNQTRLTERGRLWAAASHIDSCCFLTSSDCKGAMHSGGHSKYTQWAI